MEKLTFSGRLLLAAIAKEQITKFQYERPITLGIGDIMVSGYLSNNQECKSETAELLKQAAQVNAEAQSLSDTVEGQIFIVENQGQTSEGETPHREPNAGRMNRIQLNSMADDAQIVLKQVEIHRPSAPVVQVDWWFGRISSVSFWFEGLLSHTQSSSANSPK